MTSTPIHALLITPTHAEAATLDCDDTVSALHAAIGCDTFTVVSLRDEIDVYVDDEGLVNGSPLNLPLTVLAHQLGTAAVLFGTGVVVSIDTAGETVSLNDHQRRTVLDALTTKPDPATFEALCTSLAPLPEVVALLRASQ